MMNNAIPQLNDMAQEMENMSNGNPSLQSLREQLNDVADRVLHDSRPDSVVQEVVNIARALDYVIQYLQDPHSLDRGVNLPPTSLSSEGHGLDSDAIQHPVMRI